MTTAAKQIANGGWGKNEGGGVQGSNSGSESLLQNRQGHADKAGTTATYTPHTSLNPGPQPHPP